MRGILVLLRLRSAGANCLRAMKSDPSERLTWARTYMEGLSEAMRTDAHKNADVHAQIEW